MKRTELVRRQRIAYTRRILKAYRAASAAEHAHGAEWYAEESDRLAELALELGLPVRSVCGAAAAISPGLRWDLVPGYVDALHRNGASITVPTYSRLVVDRALACLRGEDPDAVLGGPKVRAFYRLLLTRGQSDDVVIDGHAFNLARGIRDNIRELGVTVTAARYRITAEAYRRAAQILDKRPHEVQAITWLHWRNKHGVASWQHI